LLVCLQAALRQHWRDAEQKKWRGRKPVHSRSAVATAAAAEATASSSSSSSSSLTETPIGNQFPSPLTTAERDRMQEQHRQREVEAARRDSAALIGWASEVASRSGSIVDSFVYGRTLDRKSAGNPSPCGCLRRRTGMAVGRSAARG